MMTIVTSGGGMRAYQWKAVVVILNRRNLDIPAADTMALLAIGAELPPMQIGMALPTERRRLGENQVDVAAGAGDVLMKP